MVGYQSIVKILVITKDTRCVPKGINYYGGNPFICGDIEPCKTANSSDFDPGYLRELRKEFANKPITVYLNINCLRDKIVDFRQVLYESEMDIIAILETKLSD